MEEEQRPDLPRQDAFQFLDELLSWGHFSSRRDVSEAIRMLQDHFEIDQPAAQELLIAWMELKKSQWA